MKLKIKYAARIAAMIALLCFVCVLSSLAMNPCDHFDYLKQAPTSEQINNAEDSEVRGLHMRFDPLIETARADGDFVKAADLESSRDVGINQCQRDFNEWRNDPQKKWEQCRSEKEHRKNSDPKPTPEQSDDAKIKLRIANDLEKLCRSGDSVSAFDLLKQDVPAAVLRQSASELTTNLINYFFRIGISRATTSPPNGDPRASRPIGDPRGMTYIQISDSLTKGYFEMYLKGKNEVVTVSNPTGSPSPSKQLLLANAVDLNAGALAAHLAAHPEIKEELTTNRSKQMQLFSLMLDYAAPLFSEALCQKISTKSTVDANLNKIYQLIASDSKGSVGVTPQFTDTLAQDVASKHKLLPEGFIKEKSLAQIRDLIQTRFGPSAKLLLDKELDKNTDAVGAGSLSPEKVTTQILKELEAIATDGGGNEARLRHRAVILQYIHNMLAGKDADTGMKLLHAAVNFTLNHRLSTEANIHVLSFAKDELHIQSNPNTGSGTSNSGGRANRNGGGDPK